MSNKPHSSLTSTLLLAVAAATLPIAAGCDTLETDSRSGSTAASLVDLATRGSGDTSDSLTQLLKNGAKIEVSIGVADESAAEDADETESGEFSDDDAESSSIEDAPESEDGDSMGDAAVDFAEEQIPWPPSDGGLTQALNAGGGARMSSGSMSKPPVRRSDQSGVKPDSKTPTTTPTKASTKATTKAAGKSGAKSEAKSEAKSGSKNAPANGGKNSAAGAAGKANSQSSTQGKTGKAAAKSGPAQVGDKAPAFELKSTDGRSISLASLKGKVVLLEFWASWCGPCKRATPVVDQISRDFAGRGVVVLGMNSDESLETVQKYNERLNVGYPTLLDADPVMKRYGINAVPTFVIIGKGGKIRDIRRGLSDDGEELRRAITVALAP